MMQVAVHRVKYLRYDGIFTRWLTQQNNTSLGVLIDIVYGDKNVPLKFLVGNNKFSTFKSLVSDFVGSEWFVFFDGM